MERWVPWVVGGVGGGFAVAAAILRAVNGPDPNGVNHYTVAGVALGGSLAVLGALILRRHPRHRIGWFLVGCSVAAGIVAVSNEWLVLGRGELPGSVWAAWLASWVWLVGFLLLPTVLVSTFPTGRAPSPGWRPVVWAIVAVWVIDASWMATTPLHEFPDGWARLENPLPWTHGFERLEDRWTWWPIALIGVFVLAVGSLVARLRGAEGVERRQLMPFTIAAVLAIGWLLSDLSFGLSDDRVWPSVIGSVLMPLGAAIGIVAYRLLDVDRVVSRSLTLVFLTTAAAIVYGFTLFVAAAFFVTDDLRVNALAVGLVAASALPAWRWARDAAERLIFGARADPAAVIRGLGRRLEALVDADVAAHVVADTVRRSLRLPWVRVELDGRGHVEFGVPRSRAHEVDLRRGDRSYGCLAVAARSDVDPLTDDERTLIDDLARDLVDVLHAIELRDELRHARDELVRAREEERRRIRNDLHDGLGPQLAGIGLQLDIASSRLADANHPAAHVMASAKAALNDAIVDIRRLVEGLRPPALDEIGLVSAITQQVAALSGGEGRTIDVSVTSEGPLAEMGAAVEVAAFRIATEAVSNAVRHSSARRCTVTIRCEDRLVVEVSDDGCGLSAGRSNGVGLSSMRQRAEELGGTFEIESATGGTTVRARLPIRSPEPVG